MRDRDVPDRDLQIRVDGRPVEPRPDPPPVDRRRRRLVALAVVVVVVTALAVTDLVGDRRQRERSAEAAALRLAVTGASATGTGTPSSQRQSVTVDLSVRNEGPSTVRVLAQRLDGGLPVDTGPAVGLAPGATAVLPVRWRVLCSEIGSLGGPRSLDLVLRTSRGEVRRVGVPLGDEPRGVFRAAALEECEVLLR